MDGRAKNTGRAFAVGAGAGLLAAFVAAVIAVGALLALTPLGPIAVMALLWLAVAASADPDAAAKLDAVGAVLELLPWAVGGAATLAAAAVVWAVWRSRTGSRPRRPGPEVPARGQSPGSSSSAGRGNRASRS